MPFDAAPANDPGSTEAHPGDKYLTLGSFDELSMLWEVAYPKTGEVVTLVYAEPHHEPELRALGISLLLFKEYPAFPLCDRRQSGIVNFRRVE